MSRVFLPGSRGIHGLLFPLSRGEREQGSLRKFATQCMDAPSRKIPIDVMLGGFPEISTRRSMKFVSRSSRFVAISCFVLVSVACSSPSEPETAVLVRPEPESESAEVIAVRAIRAAGADDGSALQVNPWRDPAVEGFVAEAAEAEKAQQYDLAYVAISKARNLVPESPDLLQAEAEIEFLRGNTIEAEKLAYESFKNGPQVGRLCQQNWQTIVEARKVFKDTDYLVYAQSKLDACKVKRPVRL